MGITPVTSSTFVLCVEASTKLKGDASLLSQTKEGGRWGDNSSLVHPSMDSVQDERGLPRQRLLIVIIYYVLIAWKSCVRSTAVMLHYGTVDLHTY